MNPLSGISPQGATVEARGQDALEACNSDSDAACGGGSALKTVLAMALDHLRQGVLRLYLCSERDFRGIDQFLGFMRIMPTRLDGAGLEQENIMTLTFKGWGG